MAKQIGTIEKMKTKWKKNSPIQYWLRLADQAITLNDKIGQEISMRFTQNIYCVDCGKKTDKSFSQGFCFPCFKNSPENSECIIRPELCEAHVGMGRDPKWEETYHNTPHVVYLALSSAVKVGVTSDSQVPTRWIDQGATKAIRFADVPYRFLSGQIEVLLKDQVTDRTNWRKMLKNEIDDAVDLNEEKLKLAEFLSDDLKQYISSDNEICQLNFPVEIYPGKVKSLGFDKTPEVSGVLNGIKGQYLLLDDDRVINMRKHRGYEIEFETKARAMKVQSFDF